MASDTVAPLRPSEFCALQRALVAGMTMRKKRALAMGPVQALKMKLLERVQAVDPEPHLFTAALAQAVIDITEGQGTGPAQAVASDLQMDWHLACSSPGFVVWLRSVAQQGAAIDPASPSDS
ncbi:MAG: hypothetical protein NVSMB2_02810 [Chloroflexota bacterium]